MTTRIPFDQLLGDAGFVSGWHGNGEPLAAVKAIVVHDTVTDLDEGRGYNERLESYAWRLAHDFASPPPPVYHVLYGDDGQRWVIASGRANHNGYGDYGNDTIGLACETRGGMARPEPANAAQLDAIAEDARRIRARYGDVPVLGHRETDPKRKIDPHGVDLDALRARVAGEYSQPDDQEDDVTKRGDQGADVRRLQGWGNIALHGTQKQGMTVDGDFGEQTEKYVYHLEKLAGRGKKERTGRVNAALWSWLESVVMATLYHGYRLAGDQAATD